MKILLTILLLTFSFLSFGQNKKDTIKVLAKLETHFSDSTSNYSFYKVIKILKGNKIPKRIYVFYLDSVIKKESIDTLVLYLTKFKGIDSINNVFYYDSFERARVESFTNWGDYHGKIEVKDRFNFYRDNKINNWFLITPTGGSYTQGHLIQKDSIIQETKDLSLYDGPPIIDLSNLNNGYYIASYIGCVGAGKIGFFIKREDTKSKTYDFSIKEIDSLLLFNKSNKYFYPNKTAWGGLTMHYYQSKLVYIKATNNGETSSLKREYYLNNGKTSKIMYSENEHKTPAIKANNLSLELNKQEKVIINSSFKKKDSLKINNLIKDGKSILKFLKKEKLDVHYLILDDYLLNKNQFDSTISVINNLISDNKLIRYPLKNMHSCGGEVIGSFNKEEELQKIEATYQGDNGYIQRVIHFNKNRVFYTSYKEFFPELKKDILYYCYNSFSNIERQLKINGKIINKLHFEETKEDREFIININKCTYKMEHDLLKEYKTNVK